MYVDGKAVYQIPVKKIIDEINYLNDNGLMTETRIEHLRLVMNKSDSELDFNSISKTHNKLHISDCLYLIDKPVDSKKGAIE